MDIRILRVIIWCRVRCCDILFFDIFSATIIAGQLSLSLSLSLAFIETLIATTTLCMPQTTIIISPSNTSNSP